MKRFLCYLLCITMLMTLSPTSFAEDAPQYQSLGDPAVQQILTDELYASLIDNLPGEDYAVTDIQTVYISQEYLDELAFNSQSNIFFGYTLAELDEQFTGTRYVFTVGDAGETIAQPFEAFQDDTLQQVIRNVAIGTGVILVCVTVSSLTVTAAPAVSMIFAVAAKTGTVCALKGGAMGALSAAVVTGLQTGDLDEALKAGALAGSEAFKWGAVTGAIAGGASAAYKLKHPDPHEIGPNPTPKKPLNFWQQSEKRVADMFPDGEQQVAFLNGERVPYNTKGATRVDTLHFEEGHWVAYEVKNVDLNSSSCRQYLFNSIKEQVGQRITDLPSGSTQHIILDVSDRGFSQNLINNVQSSLADMLFDTFPSYPNIPITIIGN